MSGMSRAEHGEEVALRESTTGKQVECTEHDGGREREICLWLEANSLA